MFTTPSALRSALYFEVKRPYIYLGPSAPNNPKPRIGGLCPQYILYAPKTYAIFIAKIWFQSINESSPTVIQTCLVNETLQIYTQNGAHNIPRFVQFPMLFGMGPVSRLPPAHLHTG